MQINNTPMEVLNFTSYGKLRFYKNRMKCHDWLKVRCSRRTWRRLIHLYLQTINSETTDTTSHDDALSNLNVSYVFYLPLWRMGPGQKWYHSNIADVAVIFIRAHFAHRPVGWFLIWELCRFNYSLNLSDNEEVWSQHGYESLDMNSITTLSNNWDIPVWAERHHPPWSGAAGKLKVSQLEMQRLHWTLMNILFSGSFSVFRSFLDICFTPWDFSFLFKSFSTSLETFLRSVRTP